MSSASQRPSLIANKAKRAQVFAKLRATKKAEQKERRKKRSREEEAARAAGEEAPAKLVRAVAGEGRPGGDARWETDVQLGGSVGIGTGGERHRGAPG